MELETKCDIITLNTMKKIKVFFVVVVVLLKLIGEESKKEWIYEYVCV